MWDNCNINTNQREDNMAIEQTSWRMAHNKLGCYGCKFADKKSLGKCSCCTYPSQLEIDEDGKCLVKQKRKGVKKILIRNKI